MSEKTLFQVAEDAFNECEGRSDALHEAIRATVEYCAKRLERLGDKATAHGMPDNDFYSAAVHLESLVP